MSAREFALPITGSLFAWHDAAQEKPDADEAVLALNAHHTCYWVASWDGENWVHTDTMELLRVTHWMRLPDPPTP